LEELQSLAIKAFEALGCQGLARTDFFLTDSGFVITEVNTMPGFTPISMYPALWQASGMSYRQLIEQLIQTGLSFGSEPR
jgi:D-alanine-D-alanine ligase